MRYSFKNGLLHILVILGVATAAGPAAGADSLRARIIWIENDRAYINAGTAQGVAPGWRFRFADSNLADTSAYAGTIDQVYPDLCSAPAGPLPAMDLPSLINPHDVYLFPAKFALPHIPHLRVGYPGSDRAFHLPDDLVEWPLFSSLFYPWTRGGKLGGLWPVDDSLALSTADGKTWTLKIDTTQGLGCEFPHGWGALADRLNSLINENDSLNCPTVWALRPHPDEPLGKAGVYFDGFSQVEDTALGLNFATPFYTFPDYLHSGKWRREVAAAGHFDAELYIRAPAWVPSGRDTWVRRTAPPNLTQLPFLIDTLSIVPFAEYVDQWLAFELGQLDLCRISIDDRLRAAADNPEYRLVSTVQNALVVFGVNQQKRDLSDNRLTTAVCYLCDKPSLVRALLAGQAVEAHTIFAENHRPAGEPYYAHDPRKGRQILRDLRLRRVLNFYVDERIDRGKTVAKYIAGKLDAGGIKTRLIVADNRMFADAAYSDSMDVFLYLWPLDPQAPDPGLYSFLYGPCRSCGTNPLAIDQPRFLNLLEKARQEKNPLNRHEYYRQIEYDLLAEPFICPLFRPIMTLAASKWLPDLRLTESGEIDIVTPGDWVEKR